MDEASAIDRPPPSIAAEDVSDSGSGGGSAAAESASQDAKTPTVAAAIDRRAGRRGLTSRKRLALTIDAELTSETGQQKDSETRDGEASTTPADGGTSSESSGKSSGADAVPWWVLEYRCPPPGHLGAHDVPVAVKDAEKTEEEGSDEKVAAEEKPGESKQPVFGRQFVHKPAAAANLESKQQSDAVRDLRHRRQQSVESIDYSPSQKRKLVHVHEHDPSALSSEVVAKEPKRFHEPSAASLSSDTASEPPVKNQQQQQPTGAVTPSNLVRPLNKIDIHSERSAAPTATDTTASYASKSA